MGLLDDFKNDDEQEFSDEKDFEDRYKNQAGLAQRVLSLASNFSDLPEESNVDYFFYAQNLENAEALVKDLQKLNYEPVISEPDSGEKLFCITGEIRIQLTDEVMAAWSEKMCETGYKNDCKFDGWGTGFHLEE